METTPNKSNTDTAVKVVSTIFGAAHFVFQSLADLTAEAEGTIIEKITKGEISKSSAIQNRKTATALTQTNILLKVQEFKNKQSKPQTA